MTEFAACLALRLVHYAVLLAAFIYVILGGIDEFTGSYETLTGWLGIVPQGPESGAGRHRRRADAVGDVLQRGAGRGLPARAGAWPDATRRRRAAAPAAPAAPERGSGRFDPRAIVLAAFVATALLLASTAGRCCSA